MSELPDFELREEHRKKVKPEMWLRKLNRRKRVALRKDMERFKRERREGKW